MVSIEEIDGASFELLRGVEKCFRDGDLVYFINELNNKQCTGWRLNNGESYMITRSEQCTDRKTWVVCCFQGANLVEAAEAIVKMAACNGFDTVRFHTTHPAIARMISKLKPEFFEYVYEVRCNHGKSVEK